MERQKLPPLREIHFEVIMLLCKPRFFLFYLLSWFGFVSSLLMLLTLGLPAKALTIENQKKILYFITQRSEAIFTSGGQALFKENTVKCSACEIVPQFVGDEKGYIYPLKVLEALQKIPESTKIVVFDFNFKTTEEMFKWSPYIEKLSKDEILIFVQAGVPEPGERPHLLSQTFFGKLKDVFLFAELSAGERMWPDSHFGFEIFTAKKMPEPFQGQGLVALDFASRWLPKSDVRKPAEWISHFIKKKFGTKRLWVEAQELF
jgi:hypothetical protein